MRLAIDAWDPSYGSSIEGPALVASEVPVDIDVEVPVAEWAPRVPAPAARPWSSVVFVDGVQRIDARAWITDDHGVTRQGTCASYAAGAVRCDGAATVVQVEVRRTLFACAEGAADVVTRHGTYELHATTGDDPDSLRNALQHRRADLEVTVAQGARNAGGDPAEPIVVDGPLRQHRLLAGAVGYIKAQHSTYGPPIVQQVAGRLGPGERTPLFVVGEGFTRWSWYVRLPGPVPHDHAATVRCEARSDLTVGEAAALADTVTLSLPRFASEPHKERRAPQNLYPIAGLERELRRRLGDARLLERALRLAAVA